MEILFIGIISYLMGSIPFGLILTKIFLKKDIRNIGSGILELLMCLEPVTRQLVI